MIKQHTIWKTSLQIRMQHTGRDELGNLIPVVLQSADRGVLLYRSRLFVRALSKRANRKYDQSMIF